MDEGILNDDYFMDIMNAPQLYTLELWVEKIELNDGQQQNAKKKKKEIKSEVKETGGRKSKHKDKRKSEQKEKGHKDKGGQKLTSTPPPPSPQKKKRRRSKSFNFGIEDYLLPNGKKPFRIHFNFFDIKNITLTQVEFDKLLYLTCIPMLNGDVHKHSDEIKSDDHNIDGSPNAQSTSHSDTEVHDQKIPNQIMPPPQTVNEVRKEPEESNVTTKIPPYKIKKPNDTDYIFNMNKIMDLVDEDIFIPRNECSVRKGGCITLAYGPFQLMYALQKGPLVLKIDRYGGRINDEGDPVGEVQINIPPEWKDVIYRIATNPRESPTTVQINDLTPVKQESSGTEIGKMEYTLTMTCFAGCIFTQRLPTQVGLYEALIDSITPSIVCQKPTVRENINYGCLKRKALQEDYKKLFSP